MHSRNHHWLSNDTTFDSYFLTCPQFKHIEKHTFRSFQILSKFWYFCLCGRRIKIYFEQTPDWTKHYNVVTNVFLPNWLLKKLFQVHHDLKSRLWTILVLQFDRYRLSRIVYWTSEACLDVRSSDWTQVFISLRRQGITMTHFHKEVESITSAQFRQALISP